jgi:membrane protein
VVALRQRSRFADIAVRALEGYRRHRSGRNAALIAHFGFLSVFPLFLAFATVLGLILHSHTSFREHILGSAMEQLPFVGQQIATDPTGLRGSTVVLALGLAAAIWAGMKAFVAVHGAFDDVAEEPLDDRADAIRTRLRALLGMAYVGAAQVGGAIIASIVGATGTPVVGKVLLVAGTALVDGTILLLSYRWLRTNRPPWRSQLPGAVIGGVLFALLQLVGVALVGRQIANASPVYGTFASVIGLLFWLSLHAIIALAGAELNAVLTIAAAPASARSARHDAAGPPLGDSS